MFNVSNMNLVCQDSFFFGISMSELYFNFGKMSKGNRKGFLIPFTTTNGQNFARHAKAFKTRS